MTRNLKALGLALVAMFAMSAMVASAASAQQGFLTSDGPVKLDGVENAEGVNAVTAFGLAAECPGSVATGEAIGGGFIESGSTTFTVTAAINQEACHSGSFPVTVDTNGCHSVIHLGETMGENDTFGGNGDLVCPEGKEVTVTMWFSEAEHLESKEACTVHVPPQSGLAGAAAIDTTNGTIVLEETIKGIQATKTKDNLHPLLCPAATTQNAVIEGSATVTGTNQEGESTPIGLSHN